MIVVSFLYCSKEKYSTHKAKNEKEEEEKKKMARDARKDKLCVSENV